MVWRLIPLPHSRYYPCIAGVIIVRHDFRASLPSTSYISIPATHGFHVTMCKFTDGVTHLYVPISSLFWHCLKTRQFESRWSYLVYLVDTSVIFKSGMTTLSWSRTLCRNHIGFYVHVHFYLIEGCQLPEYFMSV
jgi:hypothetical protein